jgi:hypothetical protein
LYNNKDLVNAQNCKELEKLSFNGVDLLCRGEKVIKVKPFRKKLLKKFSKTCDRLVKVKLLKNSEANTNTF